MNWDNVVNRGGRGVFLLLWLLVAALAFYAGARFRFVSDWTATGRNSLTRPSIRIVKSLHGPVSVIAFAHGAATRRNLRALISKYRRVDPAIRLAFVNPDKHPGRVRRLGIRFNGEIEIRYQARHALVLSPTETGITNTLARLARTGTRELTFLTGNKERHGDDPSGLGLSSWVQQLRARGFTVTTFNPGSGAAFPKRSGVLVIADPRVRFLPGEIAALQTYVNNGGSLLVLLEPGHAEGLSSFLATLGVRMRQGFVVDPTSSLLTGASPDFIAVDHYPKLGPVRGMHLVTVFPTAAALALTSTKRGTPLPILTTDAGAWTQTRPLAGLVAPPHGVRAGILTLGALTEHSRKGRAGRVVVLGDSDFAANSYIGDGGNLTFAMNIANWVARDDAFINLPNRSSSDLTLTLTRGEEDVMAFGFLLILPALFLGGGVLTWWRRRRL